MPCRPIRYVKYTVTFLFDAYPEAILLRDGSWKTAIDLAKGTRNEEVRLFLSAQLVYAYKAEDRHSSGRRVTTTPDQNGRLPLHHALHDDNAILVPSSCL